MAALAAYDRNGALPATANDSSTFLQALAAHDRAQRQGASRLDPDFQRLSDAAQNGTAPYNPAADAATLQFGPWDTRVPIPAAVNEALEGTGKTLTDWGLGAKQIGARALATVDPRFRKLPAQLAQEAAQKRATDAPLMNSWGGWLGSQAPAAGAMFIPGLDGLAGMTALGAATGALTPTAPGESRLANTALGGAFGAGGKFLGDAAGGFLARRLGAAAPALTDAQRAALAQGESLDMRVTPGQRASSKPLQQLEAWAQSHPWTSGPFARLGAGNQQALDRAAAKAIGENSDVVDSTVLGRANDRLGETFENVRSPDHTILFDPQGTKAALDGIDQEFSGLLPNDMAIRDNKLVGQLDRLASEGHTTAQQLGQISSKLGKAAYKQMASPTGDRDLGQALYAVKDHADDMLESSLTGEERAEYAAARQQYRNLMQLTSRGNIVNPSTGHVSGSALASKLQQSDRPGFLFGKNQSPLYNAARFAQAFKPIVGDSGTATRMANPFDPLELAVGLPAHLAARAYLSPLGQRAAIGALRGAGALSRGAAAGSRVIAPGLRYGLRAAGPMIMPNFRSSP